MDSATDQVSTLKSIPLTVAGADILSFAVPANLRREPQDVSTVLFGDLTVTITLSAGEPYQTINQNMTIGAGNANTIFARGNIGHDWLGIILDNVLAETSETVSIHAPAAGAFIAFGVFFRARRRT